MVSLSEMLRDATKSVSEAKVDKKGKKKDMMPVLEMLEAFGRAMAKVTHQTKYDKSVVCL